MTIEVNGIALHVRDSGGPGDPVLLLHGWPDTGELWRHQVPALTAAGYRTIVPDLRGFGASSKPTDPADYAAPVILGDVVGLLDALGLARVHLVGHDWGAAIAWLVAAAAPDRVTSLTALSVGNGVSFRKAGLRQREKSWYMLLFQFAGVAERWLAADDFANLRAWSGHPDIDEVCARLADPTALTASLGLYRGITTPESMFGAAPPALPPVAAPTLGIWSSGDFALLEEGMTGSAQTVTGPWRYERVEGAGHWLQLDAPDEVNTLLLDFLASVTG
jgi:pimeloyl-ACP methyl ester carboxylesterase